MRNIASLIKDHVFIVAAFLLVSLLRLLELSSPGYLFDVVITQYDWADKAYRLTPVWFWSYTFGFMDYLPLNVAFLASIKALSVFFFEDSLRAYVLVYKGVLWLADIAAAAALINIAGVLKLKSSKWGILFYLLPSYWVITSVWGQQEGLVLALLLWSIYWGIKGGVQGVLLSTLFFITAYHFKLSALLYAPLYVYFLFRFFKTNGENLFTREVRVVVGLAGVTFLGYEITHSYLGQYFAAVVFLYIGLCAMLLYVLHHNLKTTLLKIVFMHGVVLTLVVLMFGVTAPVRFHENYIQQVAQGQKIPRSAQNIWYFTPPNVQFTYEHIALGISVYNAAFALKVAMVAYLLRILLMLYKKGLGLSSVLIFTLTSNVLYYMLSAGRVHSRYLVFALCLSLLLWLMHGGRTRAAGWVSFYTALFHAVFFVNNAALYAATSGNPSPAWLYAWGFKEFAQYYSHIGTWGNMAILVLTIAVAELYIKKPHWFSRALPRGNV